MIYKDCEIYARVYKSYSDLYSLKQNGELDKSLDIVIDHDDPEVVWYEIEWGNGEQYKTIQDAKTAIEQWK